jgi:hypothetical protein
MKRSLLALPALAIMLGAGGTATAYAHGLGPMANLNEEQQASLGTLRELMHDGKIEEAKAFAEANGLPSLKHGVRMRLDPEKKAALDAALESGDYDAFVELTADAPFADQLTPEVFEQLVEAHTLMAAGDVQGAHDLLQELNVRIPIPGIKHEFEGDHPKMWVKELSDEDKDLLDQARKLHQSGDDEGARAILESLDLPHPPMHRFRE